MSWRERQREGRRKRAELRLRSRTRLRVRLDGVVPGFPFDEISQSLTVEPEIMGYEETQALKEEIRSYFRNEINLFPDFDGPLFPRPFDRIYRVEIGEKFPTDKKARDLPGTLRVVLKKNLLALMLVKYGLFLGSIATVLLMFYLTRSYFASLSAALPAMPPLLQELFWDVLSLVFGVGLFCLIVPIHFNFRNKSQNSCAKIGRDLQAVFKGIESAYRDALRNIQADENRGGVDMVNEWPVRAAWWARLILWYPKRIEYLEKAFQIEMFRVRYWSGSGGSSAGSCWRRPLFCSRSEAAGTAPISAGV